MHIRNAEQTESLAERKVENDELSTEASTYLELRVVFTCREVFYMLV